LTGLIAAVGLAQRVGVQFVFGADGGVLLHGQNAQEFLRCGGRRTRTGAAARGRDECCAGAGAPPEVDAPISL